MKINLVGPEIICLKRSLKKKPGIVSARLPFLNSAVNGRKFTKFLHDVAIADQFLKSKWRYPKPFRNAKVTNWSILTVNLVAMATALERSGKGSDR